MRQLDTGVDAQLPVHLSEMVIHGMRRQMHLFAYLSIREAHCHQTRDTSLHVREIGPADGMFRADFFRVGRSGLPSPYWSSGGTKLGELLSRQGH